MSNLPDWNAEKNSCFKTSCLVIAVFIYFLPNGYLSARSAVSCEKIPRSPRRGNKCSDVSFPVLYHVTSTHTRRWSEPSRPVVRRAIESDGAGQKTPLSTGCKSAEGNT